MFAADKYGRALTGYAYSEFGEVYVRKRGLGGRFVPRTAKVPEEVLNRETVNRLYTGGTQEQLSGLVHLDARHYSPAKTKFVQPDPYNLTELSLPEEARHTLVKAAGLTLEGLLADPSQQLSNSYVSNNPLKWTDPLGLSPFMGPGMDFVSGQVDDYVDESLDDSGLSEMEQSILGGFAGGAVMGGVMFGIGGGMIAGAPGAVAGAFAGVLVGPAYGAGMNIVDHFVSSAVRSFIDAVKNVFSRNTCK